MKFGKTGRRLLTVVASMALTVTYILAEHQNLVVITTDGSKTSYSLTSNPEVNFAGAYLIVESDKERVEYPIQSVNRIVYENDNVITTGLDNIDGDVSKPYLEDGRTLIVSGLRTTGTVEIFGTDGRLYLSRKVSADTVERISLDNLTAGVYMVRINNTTHKLLVK